MAFSTKTLKLISPRLLFLCDNSNFRFLLVRNLQSLPVEWKRPKKLAITDPLRTGDGTLEIPVDMKKSPLLVEKSVELEKSDEIVKKLFTFEFLGRKYAMQRAKTEMVESVRNHEYDKSSLEAKIARKTADIRNLVEHTIQNPTHRRHKIYLNDSIQKRRKFLRMLRKFDYKRFEWLLEKLDLTYTPNPIEKEFVERKKSIRKLADQYCENHKQHKLNVYKEFLESQKADYLKEKIETLKWIQKEELECGVKSTVSEAEINSVVRKHEKLLRKISQKPVVEDTSRNILTAS